MLLVEKWAWGLMTLPTVQSIAAAAAAVKDQAQGNLLRRSPELVQEGHYQAICTRTWSDC